MTKYQAIKKIKEEIEKCDETYMDEEYGVTYSHTPMAQGSYMDGLLYALSLLSNEL